MVELFNMKYRRLHFPRSSQPFSYDHFEWPHILAGRKKSQDVPRLKAQPSWGLGQLTFFKVRQQVDPASYEHFIETLRQGSAGALRVAAAARVLQREAHKTSTFAKDGVWIMNDHP